MYRAVTQGIEVTATPEYRPDQSDPSESRYVWAYTIEIANRGGAVVQLLSRVWQIVDHDGHTEEVRGPGVVGEQPILKPGEAFRYQSGCPLRTPSGVMAGTYQMVDQDGAHFEVAIPAFSLDSPAAPRVLN